MPNVTKNYGLKKPLPEEFYDVNVQNENLDIIDEALGKCASIAVTSEVPEDSDFWIDPSEDFVEAYTKEETDVLLAGKAPSGFGLGVGMYTAITANEIDNLNKTGIYWYRDPNVSIYEDPWGTGCMGWVIHIQGDGTNVLGAYQKFIPYHPTMQATTGYGYCSLERRKSDVGWNPWDWINPPMMIGREYRTTERHMGKPVYAKVVDCGLSPSGAQKEIPINSENIEALVRIEGRIGTSTFPFLGGISSTTHNWNAWISTSGTNILIWCGESMANNQCYATVYYTKTTD